MNWYVLYVLSRKANQLVKNLNKRKGIEAFIPQYEYYHRYTNDYVVKPMFPNYIFIKTMMNQKEFNLLLWNMEEEKSGFIKQLVNNEVSALRKEEIQMFNELLNDSYIVKMSQAYLHNGKAVVYNGPLKYFEDHIMKVDKHNQLAYLDLSFMDRNIQVGLKITGKNESSENGLPPLDMF